MNVLIIGLGSIARKHITALKSLNFDSKIYALRSSLNATIEEGVENIYDIDNSNDLFDFAIISNPTNLHYEYIEKLAQKGIPLFIEKPAIHKLENADKLVQLIEEQKKVTYVACNLRFHPCIVFLKNKIDTERLIINEVNVYCGSYLPDWRPGKDFRTIYSAYAAMGGGVHLDLFHELDYTTWFFGLPNNNSSITRKVSTLNIDSIDYANYSFQYPCFTANIILNYYRRKPKRQIEIVLENDTWTIDLINNCITNDEGNLIFEVKNFSINETYNYQIKYFVDCLKNNQKPMNSLKESIEILKIILKE